MSITHCYCQILNVYTFFYFMSISKLAAACNPPSKKVNQIPFLYNQEMKPRISKQVVGHDRRIYTTIHHNRLRNNLYFKFQFLKYPSTAIFFCHRIETRGIKRLSMEAPGRDKYVGLHRRKKLLGVKNFHGAQKLRPLYNLFGRSPARNGQNSKDEAFLLVKRKIKSNKNHYTSSFAWLIYSSRTWSEISKQQCCSKSILKWNN